MNRLSQPLSKLAALVAALLVVGGLAANGAAAQAVPTTPTTIYACVSANGATRIVTGTDQCKRGRPSTRGTAPGPPGRRGPADPAGRRA